MSKGHLREAKVTTRDGRDQSAPTDSVRIGSRVDRATGYD